MFVCVRGLTVDNRVPVNVVRKVDTKLVIGCEAGMAVSTTSRHVQVKRGPMQWLATTVQTAHEDLSIDDGCTRTEGTNGANS